MAKKIFNLDLNRCVGCYACMVACMDQNDIGENQTPLRKVFTLEKTKEGKEYVSYVSLACMHCEDAPCIIGCPTGAISKDSETNLTIVDESLCIGCHSCVMACPYGAPKFKENNKMVKCQGCVERVKNGLIPACVRACPTKALKFGAIEEIEAEKQDKLLRRALEKIGDR